MICFCFNCLSVLETWEAYSSGRNIYECHDCNFWYELDDEHHLYMMGFNKFGKTQSNYLFSLTKNCWFATSNHGREVQLDKYLIETSTKEFKIIYDKMIKICNVLSCFEQANADEDKYIDFENNVEKYINMLAFL